MFDSEYIIREANPDDIEGIGALVRATLRETYAVFASEAHVEERIKHMSDQHIGRDFFGKNAEKYQVFVAELDGEIVSMGAVLEKEDHLRLTDFFTHPKHQQKGVGTEVFRAALKSVVGEVCEEGELPEPLQRMTLRVHENNLVAKDFYKSVGFRAVRKRNYSARYVEMVAETETVLNALEEKVGKKGVPLPLAGAEKNDGFGLAL